MSDRMSQNELNRIFDTINEKGTDTLNDILGKYDEVKSEMNKNMRIAELEELADLASIWMKKRLHPEYSMSSEEMLLLPKLADSYLEFLSLISKLNEK